MTRFPNICPHFLTHGDGPYDRREVTIRHLASHMSGAALPENAESDDMPDLDQVRIETRAGRGFSVFGIGNAHFGARDRNSGACRF